MLMQLNADDSFCLAKVDAEKWFPLKSAISSKPISKLKLHYK
jgi:hypothetical protein